MKINEYKPDHDGNIAAKVKIFAILIILSLVIGAVNIQDIFFEPVSAQADINTNYDATNSNRTQNNILLITNIPGKES